jgi:hypothetical protein
VSDDVAEITGRQLRDAARRRRRARWLGAFVLLVACGRDGGRTVHELRVAIEQYRTHAEATDDRVQALFARLDGDIAALRAESAGADGAAHEALVTRVDALEHERAALRAALAEARARR